MDFTNTVKVSNIRAVAAYKKALNDLEDATPEIIELSERNAATRETLYQEAMSVHNGKRRHYTDAKAVWDAYESEYRNWWGKSSWSRGPEPSKPPHGEPYRPSALDYPPTKRYVMPGKQLVELIKERLEQNLAVASVSLGPFRITHKEACHMANCESGKFIQGHIELLVKNKEVVYDQVGFFGTV